ncbi:MAG: Zn-dependent hydrolase [Myxococcales bacterium]|nr:Zn-dependent hydrolase [Myxococcales bacterium]
MKNSETPSINIDRLRANMLKLGQIGRHEGGGLCRLGFTNEDMEARRWLMETIDSAGGIARLDGAGNVIGRWFDGENAPVVLGSHIDSVMGGGLFDGTLGVLAGVECARAVAESAFVPKRPLEIVAFADEEGRFGGMFGVQAFIGQITPDWLERAVDPEGVRLCEAMAAQGLEPMAALSAARRPEDIHAFLELHIEQGPVLEAENRRIGVVEGISGIFKWMVHLRGRANHAGTSPMHLRSDAFMGLADFAHEIPRILDEEGSEGSRLTVGKVELLPGNPHTVPGEVVFSLVGRDIDPAVLQRLADACQRVLSAIARKKGLHFEYSQLSWLEPQRCHPEVIESFLQAARNLGEDPLLMPSGAGHDTQFMAKLTRAGMIFVPSVAGISHAPDELTHWTDVELGAQVLLRALVDWIK